MSEYRAGEGFASTVPNFPALSTAGNLLRNWRRWRSLWEAYEAVTDLKQRGHKYRIAKFTTAIGADALGILNELHFENDKDEENLDVIISMMERHCMGMVNVAYERYVFDSRNQERYETIDRYVADLECLAETCDFGVLRNELIRDRIICGICNNMTRQKLFEESELTLSKCLAICREDESIHMGKWAMSGDENDNIYNSNNWEYITGTAIWGKTNDKRVLDIPDSFDVRGPAILNKPDYNIKPDDTMLDKAAFTENTRRKRNRKKVVKSKFTDSSCKFPGGNDDLRRDASSARKCNWVNPFTDFYNSVTDALEGRDSDSREKLHQTLDKITEFIWSVFIAIIVMFCIYIKGREDGRQ